MGSGQRRVETGERKRRNLLGSEGKGKFGVRNGSITATVQNNAGGKGKFEMNILVGGTKTEGLEGERSE